MESKRRVISLLVDNQSGVLARVSNLFCRRGFNIDSLTVSATNDPAVSRITVTITSDEKALSQLILQTERLEVTRQVFELTPDKSLQRELLLLKVACNTAERAEMREIAAIYKSKIIDLSPDSMVFELTGRPVQLTQGDYANLKITTREDLPRAEQKEGNDMRIGHGYDVHRLVEDRKLILGGVEVPFEKGLLGHSDADVLAHAVMDAVLGAAALGDIGQHFPDNDPEYAGADSLKLACRVAQILKEHGWRIENIDATLLTEPSEMDLIRMLAAFPQEIVMAAEKYDPSRINRFVIDLASAFHRFYGNCRIQGADPAVQQARLALCIGVKNVIFNVLTMFKINVPEKM